MINEEKYYRSMLNGLYGLVDDFDANHVPDTAKELLLEIIEICKLDLSDRFTSDKAESRDS
jgi:hypothetical protein